MPLRPTLLAAALLIALGAPTGVPAGAAPGPVTDPTVAPARDTEPVILTGAAFGDWATPGNVTAKAPLTDLRDCQTFDDRCKHNHYATPEVDSATVAAPAGADVSRLTGWRWDGTRFVQVPFQVDEVFTRYLNNSASGFSHYSGEDRHTTYAFDREGFRWTASDPADPCRAVPDSPVATDPVAGLDTDDEVVFMASDAGAPAPAGAKLPAGVTAVRAVEVVDPARPLDPARVVYVMQGVTSAFTAADGYVRYQRDANADTFEFSQSSYEGYGNAARGVHCDEAGNVIGTDGPRRPRDRATVTTPRYSFRYDGRWLMTSLRISPDGGASYGPDLVDRWKARAFQQDPGSETPCCGYEEEDTNWGGSSTLLGERSGPVRTIRETWGADSGTNVVRRETFYRDEMRQKTWLRVHPIPPLDGIYAQWDFNAGVVDRFYTPRLPAGVPVDGVNDELFGNLDDPCNAKYDGNSTSEHDQRVRQVYRQAGLCRSPYHQSIDLADPTSSDPNVALSWTQITGDAGTVVSRYRVDPPDMTVGGSPQALLAVPYYRDDARFDDGTGSDPGPKLKLRSADEPTVAPDGTPRRYWTPADGPTGGSPHFYQGSIGTHGLHLLLVAESDNARATVPLTEIVSEHRNVYLPGRRDATAGEQYGRGAEHPLVTRVSDVTGRFESGGRAATTTTYTGATRAEGGSVAAAARLVDDAGAPIAGATIEFSIRNGRVEAVTGDDGTATAAVPDDGRGGTIHAKFRGDAGREPSSDAAKLDRDG